MYFIYKITNNINGKIYIGSSTVERGYDKRWQEHKASSKYTNGKCYNYPLYKAIRKYGEENFDYEIIEDNIITLEERAHREKFYILKYNSINRDKGYNQTLETECALKDNRVKSTKEYMKKCALVNNKNEIIILFQSVHEAAEFVHDDPSRISACCHGKIGHARGLVFRFLNDIDLSVILPDKNIIKFDEENNYFSKKQARGIKRKIVAIPVREQNKRLYFNSVLEASEELNIDRGSIHQCLKGNKKYTNSGGYVFRDVDENNNIVENDIPLEEALSRYLYYDGRYQTITEWAKEYNINQATLRNRIKKQKMSLEDALNKKG